MAAQQAEAPRHLAVDQPILNSPFREPTRYWLYEGGEPSTAAGRRPAGYYFRERRSGGPQLSYLQDEQYNDLPVVNELRTRVRDWRERGWRERGRPGVSPITRQLLGHWANPERERRLFFCQIEAAETVIWLLETDAGHRFMSEYRQELPLDGALRRLACKMATGSGKTVVMAMIAAWSILNKAHAPGRARFADAILVVCPNLTVRERLGGAPKTNDGTDEPERPLIPGGKGNYYEAFDLVPTALLPALGRGRFLVTNWHTFLPEDDGRRRGVVQRGPESDAAFCARVLRDLGNARNLLVINDEAHHCYRPRPEADFEGDRRLADEQNEEATIWLNGLDRIQAVRGILACIDLSATPFFIQGSGYPEGTPFPWIVSDFGLVDAIESGIVKVPRVPVASDSGRPVAEYFRLWESVNAKLQPHERGSARRRPKPEAIVREADGALQQLAGEWTEMFHVFERDKYPVPPCLIVVCDNTGISELIFERIGVEGRVFGEYLRNEDGAERTLRIDTKLLAKAEAAEDGGSREERAEALRRKVATVGKPDEPGAEVRCVVSVGMLTEGWDAHNVTHILGLRAFESQLLCEQVVGRGLRRMNYDFELDEEGVPIHVEYVDVYGIPFEVIPVKKQALGRTAPPPRETMPVQAVREREALRIEFPRVEGYVYEVQDQITADVSAIEPIRINPSVEPTQTIVRAKVGYELGTPGLRGPGETETQTREQFYAAVRFQELEYELARRVVQELVGRDRFHSMARHTVFPQVLAIARAYLRDGVDYGPADRREIGLEPYMVLATERLIAAIRPVKGGEPRLMPRLERFRPRGSTSEVSFRTTREVRQTLKSHVSHVVLDSPIWEGSVAFQLEMMAMSNPPLVESYARNDHLELTIPYEFMDGQHVFKPDYVIRLTNGVHLLFEVKGREEEQDRVKYQAARRWCDAVNTWGEMGRWAFEVCRAPRDVPALLRKVAASV